MNHASEYLYPCVVPHFEAGWPHDSPSLIVECSERDVF